MRRRALVAAGKGGIKYEFVDLGLPSGTLWCKSYVGTTDETDYGLYFAWGDIVGHYWEEKPKFRGVDYKFGDTSSADNMTKYNSVDGKTSLDLIDDAAYVHVGSSCHIPTVAQYQELVNSSYTTRSWQQDYEGSGRPGYLITSKINGNSLFVLGAASISEGRDRRWEKSINTWLNAINPDNLASANTWAAFGATTKTQYSGRGTGLCVRAVIDGTNP